MLNRFCTLNPPPVEVAIHTILYVRQVYPAEIFVRRKMYETPVYQSRHPGLNAYIAGAVKAIGDELVLVSAPPRCAEKT
jgi:mitotic spindle assembly checkpoint protein MAD2B